MHPSERCLSLVSFTPVGLLRDKFLQKRSDMVCFLSANAESLGSLLLLLRLLFLRHHFNFLLNLGVCLISCSLHHAARSILILDNLDHSVLFYIE